MHLQQFCDVAFVNLIQAATPGAAGVVKDYPHAQKTQGIASDHKYSMLPILYMLK